MLGEGDRLGLVVNDGVDVDDMVVVAPGVALDVVGDAVGDVESDSERVEKMSVGR